MALATTEIVCTTPLAIFVIYTNTAGRALEPWRSWDDTHWNFSRVEQIPAVIWRSDRVLSNGIELARWIVPACSFVFFAFFGFANEALRHYCIVFWAIVKPLGFAPKPVKAPRVADIGYAIHLLLVECNCSHSSLASK
jgi:pheromone a factor receptor